MLLLLELVLQDRKVVKMSNKITKSRASELDFLRGLSIFLMILQHLAFDIRYMIGIDVFAFIESNWFDAFLQPIFLCIFAGVSGICCVFSRNNVFRGLKLLGISIALTIITYIATFKFGFSCLILFNILHLLAICIIIYAVIELVEKKYSVDSRRINILIGFIAACIGVMGKRMGCYDYLYESWWLLPIGILVKGMPSMADWLPFFPWASAFFIGTLLGRNEYKTRESLLKGTWFDRNIVWKKISSVFEYIGRHSLVIYVVHQPIVLGLVYLIAWIAGK